MKNKSHKTKGARARMGGNVECLGNCREDGLGSENDNKCQDGHYVYRVGTMKGFCGDCKQHFPEALEYFIRQSSSQSLPRPSSNQARACVLHNQLSGQGADNTVQHYPKQAAHNHKVMQGAMVITNKMVDKSQSGTMFRYRRRAGWIL